MIVVDASVLIAYLDPDDAHHAEAVDLLAESAPPLLVHAITFAEVLVAPTRRRAADAVWQDLAAIGVKVDSAPVDPWQLARLRVETGLKMPDCCVLALAESTPAIIATFDVRLRRFASTM